MQAIKKGRFAMGFFKDSIQDTAVKKEAFRLERQAERDELSDLQSEAVLKVMSDPERFKKFLTLQAINPNLSPGNIALALSQSGGKELSQLATAEKWRDGGSAVRPEERENGIKVFVPKSYEKEGVLRKGYEVGRLYDIAQTDGKNPLRRTSLTGEEDLRAAGEALMFATRVSVQETTGRSQYDPKSRTIYINEHAAPEKAFYDLVHGVAAARVQGGKADLNVKSYLPEITSISYMVCKGFGLDAPFPDAAATVKVFQHLETDKDRAAYLNDLARVAAAISECARDRKRRGASEDRESKQAEKEEEPAP
jgi:hypothetical protein